MYLEINKKNLIRRKFEFCIENGKLCAAINIMNLIFNLIK
jgi:hypothetical protein